MDGMYGRFLGLLPLLALASGAQAASRDCSNFSGNWGLSKDAPYPGLARVEVKDCTVFTMDKIGYWNTFSIGGPAVEFKVYDSELYVQTVRGTWNSDRTELTIEEFNRIEAGFHPAFGQGITRFVIEKWTLDPQDPDILHIGITQLSFTRDSGKVETRNTQEVYYRFKGPAQETAAVKAN